MNWCCLAFKGNFQAAGERGFAVFAFTENGIGPNFALQHRSLEPGESLRTTETPVSLVSDAIIKFCPWCGADLRKQYRDSWEALDRSDLRVNF